MNILQKAFDKEFKELFAPEKLGTELLQQKLKKLGIEINEAQLSKIKKQFVNFESNVFHLELDDDQVFKAGFKSKEQFENAFKNIFNDLIKELEKIVGDLSDNLTSIILESTDKISQIILNNLIKSSKRMLKDRTLCFSSFKSDLYKIYKKAFDLLEMLIVISFEAGESFNHEVRSQKSFESDYVLNVLTRLHARACQIAYEILILLKSGFADGAHARWRTLHEVSVIGYFISINGNDTAERYLLHDGIESFDAAKIYQENCNLLGYKPLSQKELTELKDTYDNLTGRFGNNFKFDYGWASLETNNDKPTFRDIEKSVGLKHLRPYYKMACNNVHANPKGIFFKLGLYPESGDILLAGPSNAGLTDPGQLTAISLTQITSTLLTQKPNIDHLAVCKIMLTLEDEIGHAFVEAEEIIKKRIKCYDS